MSIAFLERKLQEIFRDHATVLWLEGSRTDQIESAKIFEKKLVLFLTNGTSRMVTFERFSPTKVGLQFWNKGRAGVLYRWDAISKSPEAHTYANCLSTGHEETSAPPHCVA